MKIVKLLLTILSLAVIAYIVFNEITKNKIVSPPENKIAQIIGYYDNYQIHKKEGSSHYHVQIDSASANEYRLALKISSGKNKDQLLSTQRFDIKKNRKGYFELHTENREMSPLKNTATGFESLDGFIKLSGDTLTLEHLADNKIKQPIKALKCRYFDGWFKITDANNASKNLLVENLKLHDQGDQLDLNLGEQKYMLKLSNDKANASFKRLRLTLYDLPSDSITTNSKPIHESWTNSIANKIGFNTGEISTQWSLVKIKSKKK